MSVWSIHEADALEALRQMPSESFDAALLDPPYGLGPREPTVEELVAYLTGAELDTGGDFMGKAWKIPSVAVMLVGIPGAATVKPMPLFPVDNSKPTGRGYTCKDCDKKRQQKRRDLQAQGRRVDAASETPPA